MVPDLDFQLQVSLKALSDNVVPAVDPQDSVAKEQLNLVIATLTMVRNRLPIQRRFIRRLLEDEIALAAEVAAAIDDGADLKARADAASAALADPELEAHELEDVRAELAGLTVAKIAAAGQAGLASIAPIVLRASKAPLDRFRSWCIASGFEPDPSAVAPIETLL